MVAPLQLILSPGEQKALSNLVKDSITDDPRFPVSPIQRAKELPIPIDHNAAAFRAASRVYLGTSGALKTLQIVLASISARRSPRTATPRKPLVASPNRFALSIASLLFFHRVLYRSLTRLRLQLLHQKVREIRQRWPRLYAILTSKVAPAIGASLSGLALGICPADQLRVTIAIYVLVRTGELAWSAADVAGFLKKKPNWVGSWILFALAQGQLLHAFVFDSDCFPQAYGDFILNNTPEYIQRRPAELSSKVAWPTRRQIVDQLAEMAHLNWPPFISPILRPRVANTLPPTIDTVISPITSRAHPALQHLSCALLHPSETSCFTPFLRQILLSFTTIGKFMATYYAALSLPRIKLLVKSPDTFLTHLAAQILRVTTVVVGSIATSWGSICLFNNFLPKSMFPQSRFFLGGMLGGCFAILDSSRTGHENAMYVTRTSLDSLWKVGVKRKWWKGVKGGDVYIFVACLAVLNALYDVQRTTKVGKDRTMALVKLLRGDIEVGLQDKRGGLSEKED